MKSWLLLLVLLMGTALAQAAPPEEGLRAEMAGDWVRAVEFYKQQLQDNPAQPELWERIADIRATKLNSPERAVEALREAVKYAPQEDRLWHKLAQAYAAIRQPKPALGAIDKAVSLKPNNLDYLRMRAELAAWAGENARAADSYQRLLQLAPEDTAAQLGAARVAGWQGRTDDAARRYADYLRQHPDSQQAWLEYARIQTERGDYAAAEEALETYRARFAEDKEYRKQLARTLAWANRPHAAFKILRPLLQEEPQDYDLNYTNTLARNANQQPRDARDSLGTLVRLGAERKETGDIQRFIKTPQRSNVGAGFEYRTDSDHITLHRVITEATYVLSPETRLQAGVDYEDLRARIGSGLEPIDSGDSLHYTRAWIGARHVASPLWTVDGRVGQGTVQHGDHNTIYELGATLRPADAWRLHLSRRQDLHDVSPRALSLGIERRSNRLEAEWQPDLRYTVVAAAAYDDFSDDNHRWEYVLAPRRAVLRSQSLNLDLGLSAQQYGYRFDPGHGYYAPRRYERYAVTAFGYRKLDDDDGISFALSYGPYKDNTLSGFRYGGDIVVEGFFGIYRDWYLNVRAGLSDYGGGFSQGYNARSIFFSVTRRF